MRRIGNILEETASIANIELALRASLRHRSKHNALTQDAGRFLEDREGSILALHADILRGRVGDFRYRTFTRVEHGKVRRIDWNPSFRDNVLQHALYNTVGRRLVATFIPDTYSGIEGRGHAYGRRRICSFIQSFGRGTVIYATKGDIRHYYPSIDNKALDAQLERMVKDRVILGMLVDLVDSHPGGLPIGNYLSQLFANLYLSPFDHWVKERLGLREYARYCDDMAAFGGVRTTLAGRLCDMRHRLRDMGLELKADAQVFSLASRGLDFMGLVFGPGGEVRLRKRIERSLRKAAAGFTAWPCERTYRSLASYYGWTKTLTRGRKLWDAVGRLDMGQCLALARSNTNAENTEYMPA